MFTGHLPHGADRESLKDKTDRSRSGYNEPKRRKRPSPASVLFMPLSLGVCARKCGHDDAPP